jgi:hypothetical protein
MVYSHTKTVFDMFCQMQLMRLPFGMSVFPCKYLTCSRMSLTSLYMDHTALGTDSSSWYLCASVSWWPQLYCIHTRYQHLWGTEHTVVFRLYQICSSKLPIRVSSSQWNHQNVLIYVQVTILLQKINTDIGKPLSPRHCFPIWKFGTSAHILLIVSACTLWCVLYGLMFFTLTDAPVFTSFFVLDFVHRLFS